MDRHVGPRRCGHQHERGSDDAGGHRCSSPGHGSSRAFRHAHPVVTRAQYRSGPAHGVASPGWCVARFGVRGCMADVPSECGALKARTAAP